MAVAFAVYLKPYSCFRRDETIMARFNRAQPEARLLVLRANRRHLVAQRVYGRVPKRYRLDTSWLLWQSDPNE